LYGIVLTVLFGLLGALIFWKKRSSPDAVSAGRSALAAGRRRAAVPIRDEDGQVRLTLLENILLIYNRLTIAIKTNCNRLLGESRTAQLGTFLPNIAYVTSTQPRRVVF
jgi:hypothetical protein